MKTLSLNFKGPFLFLSFMLFMLGSRAQDTIFKRDGQSIACKVMEIGTNGVSYKKSTLPDGPTFIDTKSDIARIKYGNGNEEKFSAPVNSNPVNTNVGNASPTTPSIPANNDANSGPKTMLSSDYKISIENKKYLVNGKKISIKEVDRLLAKSTDPKVMVGSKAAKTFRIIQKITGLTSIASTSTGGVATIATFSTLYNQVQKGSGSVDSYVNFGLSFVGTLALPITSKILKGSRDKLYDKAIDLYNVGRL